MKEQKTMQWGVSQSVNKPVNASKQPKGTIFGAPMSPKLMRSLKTKGLSRNYSK